VNEIDSVFADGAQDVRANVDLVHVVVSFHNCLHVLVPESVHAWVGSDRCGVASESHLLLANLDLLLTGAGLQLSLGPGVQVESSETNEELEDADSCVPPGGESITVSSVVGEVDLASSPSREEHQLNDKRHQDHVLVEPEGAKEQAKGASEASSEPVTAHTLVHHSVLVSLREAPSSGHHWRHTIHVSVVPQTVRVTAVSHHDLLSHSVVCAKHCGVGGVTGSCRPHVVICRCHGHSQVIVYSLLKCGHLEGGCLPVVLEYS